MPGAWPANAKRYAVTPIIPASEAAKAETACRECNRSNTEPAIAAATHSIQNALAQTGNPAIAASSADAESPLSKNVLTSRAHPSAFHPNVNAPTA